jgi:hypothetical protein
MTVTDAPTVRPDARLTQPLDRLAGMLRRYVMAEVLLLGAFLAVGWLLLDVALDYGVFAATNFDWVLEASAYLRHFARAMFLFICIFIGFGFAIPLGFGKSFSYSELAMVLEKRFPDLLGERLITAVELADRVRAGRSGYSTDMIDRTVEEASERVGRVPLASVFNRRRLYRKASLVAGGGGLLVAIALTVGALTARAPTVSGALHAAKDFATIWGERNLLLRDTPWPRAAYLEVLEPSVAELRLGKDAGAPRVRVRAAEWVVADASTRDGWRPLRWDDLTPDLVGVAVPRFVAVVADDDFPPGDLARAALGGSAMLSAGRPVSIKANALGAMTVDEVASAYGSDSEQLAGVFAALTTLAAEPSMGRTLRKLDSPDAVTFRYAGLTRPGAKSSLGTRGEVRLTRDPSGEFSADVTGLKESVAYTVRAKDFRTDSREIVLVPPPMLTRLSRIESVPAYLYHPAPVDAKGVRGRLLPTQLQVLAEKEFSLTGERSVATVPAGTEFVLTGVADKPLTKVLVNFKGRVPGLGTASLAVTPNGDTFTLRLASAVANSEFDLVMIDEDGVRAKRSVLIQVTDDQPPQVELAVDVLRKVGNAYLCTPRARVPFVKDSILRDDTGLSRVEYQFTATRLEAQAVVALQVQAVAGVFASGPLLPNFGAVVSPAASAVLAASLGQGVQRQFAALGVSPFERAYDALPKSTAEGLAAKLTVPPVNPEGADLVKEVKFNLDSDVFDLEVADAIFEAQGRRMRVPDSSGEVQPRYRLELNVVATDANVVSGPKTGQNLEPLRFTVVSEADLLGEITKDEEASTARFDEALKNLRTAQVKLNAEADRFVASNIPPDILRASEYRAADIAQHVAKGRDLVQSVVGDYVRLRREVETNRCNDAVPRRYQNVIIGPLESVLAGEQKATEDSIDAFREPLKEGQRPPDAAIAAAKLTLDALIRRLERVRRELGDTLSEGKLREDLRKIIENQVVVSKAIEGISRKGRERLFAPEVRPVPAIVLAAGESRKITHEVDWKLFDKGELKLRLQVTAGSEVVVPAEVVAKDDRNDFDYTVTAGKKPGVYALKIVPSVGPALEIALTVK